MNDVVVLGGTGFIGSHVVDRLVCTGRRARVLSRKGRWPWGDLPDRATLAACDLERSDATATVEALLRDATVVVHLSGTLFRPATPAARYRALHVDGTSRVLDAMRRTIARDGIGRRLVHVSTTGVLGPTGPSPLPESAPAGPTTIYESTKFEGEELALRGRGSGLEVVVARPGLVYGPRDLHLVALWKAIRAGRFRLIGGGTALWQPVHVRDVVDGLERMTIAPGIDGEVFHLAGAEPRSWKEIAECVAASLSVPVRGPGLPYGLAWITGAVLEGVFLPFGGDPPLSRSRARIFTEHRLYDISHAAERLGWRPAVTLERGVAESTAWYRREGHL